MRLLLGQINGDAPDLRRVVLRPSLVIRNSTGRNSQEQSLPECSNSGREAQQATAVSGMTEVQALLRARLRMITRCHPQTPGAGLHPKAGDCRSQLRQRTSQAESRHPAPRPDICTPSTEL